MNRDDAERLARTRYTIISAMRASGALLMVLGMWIWVGDILRAGGLPAAGVPLFAIGFLQSLIVPQILARKWRTPKP
ncbi:MULTISPECIES: hypothetical protein [Sphingomonadales]|uniref:Uncharacterized protein n=2 Tax=Edaphosphingomonas TaxID=3423724 RepID=A0A2T4HPC0_9SPHN|nr:MULTISPECIES: hypothetical protein [Sphingomonas]AGH49133.1 hypothetical protein G432_07040 [Sphingomonas sp. MM-1]MDX3883633.1 hypothetical protein [Sphingomonas sp.]OHT21557.1 hypothetical protein BHE75_03566 [Sphingomonas haloaromaticamans]PTD17642.1 hypothetical protein CV103_16755 [Sphingomonas fennica]